MKRNFGKQSLLVGFGALLTVFTLSCSNNKSENNDSAAASSDTTIMGVQGDTTTNSFDGPAAAPSDTAAGQNLPEADVKKQD